MFFYNNFETIYYLSEVFEKMQSTLLPFLTFLSR